MALNPQYDAIGKGFVQQYYILFDDPAQRPNLVNMYNVSILCNSCIKFAFFVAPRYIDRGSILFLEIDSETDL